MRSLIFFLLLLLVVPAIAQNKINSYEYWFDGHFAERQVQPLAPTGLLNLQAGIPATGLSEGLHALNIRFKDDSARYSPTVSSFFYRVPLSGQTQVLVDGWQYWFNNQFEAAVFQSLSPTSTMQLNAPVDATALPLGLHLLTLRFRDNYGRWSPAVSQFFYRQPTSVVPDNNIMVGYQYWFDQHYEQATQVPMSPASQIQLSAALPTAPLSEGLHLLNISFRDGKGLWSPVLSQFVYVRPDAPGVTQNLLTKMYYWFDQGEADAKSKVLGPQPMALVTDLLDASSLPDGLHQLHVRFEDTLGYKSSTISQFFYKSPATGITTNVITGYRYWFNQDNAAAMTITETPPQNILTLNTTIDFGCLTSGDNRFHLQFRDAKGLWSSALTDTVSATIPPSNIYRFTGNGNWSNTANWQNQSMPAPDLPGCKEIIIDHTTGGTCVLDIPQRLLKNSRLTVLPGKTLVIPKDIEMK